MPDMSTYPHQTRAETPICPVQNQDRGYWLPSIDGHFSSLPQQQPHAHGETFHQARGNVGRRQEFTVE